MPEPLSHYAIDRAVLDYRAVKDWIESPMTQNIVIGLQRALELLKDKLAENSYTQEEAAQIRATIRIYKAFVVDPARFLSEFAQRIEQAKKDSDWNELVDPSGVNTDQPQEG